MITVSATYGAGGSVVAAALAERLGLPFYDRLTHGPDTRTPERIAERLTEEERTHAPPGRVVASLSHLGSALGMPVGDAPELDPSSDLRRQVAERCRIASGGGGVVLGRAAAVLLAVHATSFHVRLDGPLDRRIAQGMRIEGVTEEVARAHQADTDKAGVASCSASSSATPPIRGSITSSWTRPRSRCRTCRGHRHCGRSGFVVIPMR